MWIAAALALLAAAPAAPAPDRFSGLFERGLEVQTTLESVRASFRETVVSSLLSEPVVAQGRLFAARPGRLRMEYDAPAGRTLIVDGDKLWIFLPGKSRPEKLDIGRTRRNIDRYFSARDEGELRRMFRIEVLDDAERPDTFHLRLTPRKKPIREGLETLEIWVDRTSLLVIRLRMSYPGGDSRTIDLLDIETGAELPAAAFAPAR